MIGPDRRDGTRRPRRGARPGGRGQRECPWTRALQQDLGRAAAGPLPSPEGMMLGVMPGVSFAQGTAHLGRGDFVVLYTDGILDRGELPDDGIDRLAKLAAAARCCPAGLLDEVDYDAAGDDACVLIAERVQ